MIDLHIHTTASDGELTPAEIVDKSLKKNLNVIAITDHDTVEGIESALNFAKGKGIEVIPGIEFESYEPGLNMHRVDILGLCIDFKNPEILSLTKSAKEGRENQKKEIIDKLIELGFDITFDELKNSTKGALGRPHIAKLLLKKYPDKFSSIQQVFDEYLGEEKSAYARRKNRITMKEIIDAIHNSGGVAFLAHPAVYTKENSLELIRVFKKLGGDGIETFYPYHLIYREETPGLVQFYRNLSESFGILETGGSDFHREDRGVLGAMEIPDSLLLKIKQRHEEIKKGLKNRGGGY